jgi:ribosomal protein S18 acetylase RimI-like enzyme
VAELLGRAAGRHVIVSTGRDNGPARTLYEKLGFTKVEDVEVIPGLWTTRYEING